MRKLIILAGVICSIAANAQTFRHYITTDDARWTQGQDVKAQTKSNTKASSVIETQTQPIVTFRNWGTTFNEQDWKALCMLTIGRE